MLTKIIALCILLTFSIKPYALDSNKLTTSNDVKVDLDNVIQYLNDKYDITVVDSQLDKNTFLEPVYVLQIKNGTLYFGQQSKKLFLGTVLDATNNYENVTEGHRNLFRIRQLDKVKHQAITYERKLNTKNVWVFTDIACSYCLELHEQMNEYLDNGINIHYLPFPLSDPDSFYYAQIRQVWCDKDKNASLDSAFLDLLDVKASCDFDIESLIELAKKIDIEATPTLIFPDGSILEGMASPEELKTYL